MKLREKFRNIVPRHENTIESLRFGIILAIIGGYMDIYTYITRGGVFANAETGNVILAAIGLASKNYAIAFNALVQIIFFILGSVVSEIFRRRRDKNNRSKIYHAKRVLLIEAIVLLIVGFIKEDYPHIIVNAIIGFISAIQISGFTTLVDAPYTSTICTGNLRHLGENLVRAIETKDKVIIARALRYLIIIVAFGLGAILGGYLTNLIRVKSIFIATIFVMIAYGMLYFDEKKAMKKKMKIM